MSLATKPKIVLVDMDGTVADLDASVIAKLKEQKLDKLAALVSGRTSFEFYDARDAKSSSEEHKLLDKVAKKIMSDPGFYANLPVIAGAVQTLKELEEKHNCRVFFCTSPLKEYKNCVVEKFAWVHKHFGVEWTRKIIIVKDKTLVSAGDVLIDDKPQQTGLMSPPAWKYILFDQSYNRSVEGARILSWASTKPILDHVILKSDGVSLKSIDGT